MFKLSSARESKTEKGSGKKRITGDDFQNMTMLASV